MALWSNGLLLLLLDALGLLWLGLLALLLLLLLCKHNQFLVIAKHPLHQRGICSQEVQRANTRTRVTTGCRQASSYQLHLVVHQSKTRLAERVPCATVSELSA